MAAARMSGGRFSAALAQGDPLLVRRVLEDLPDWFGIPEAIDTYVQEATHLPMLRLQHGDDSIGFATLDQPFPETVEISCMGICRKWHGQGAGRVLMAGILSAAAGMGARLLMVKTLGPTHPDTCYALTRRFYGQAGFMPLAEFAQIWGPEDPCLIMVRPIATASDAREEARQG